ncbi:MAG: hypothetical protein IJY72_07665, partial [Akkermansia sp.]|nr:hypothetical protein [Akkermansia sp.]
MMSPHIQVDKACRGVFTISRHRDAICEYSEVIRSVGSGIGEYEITGGGAVLCCDLSPLGD